MRSQEEIVAKLTGASRGVINETFGYDVEVLAPYLDYEHAKPFLAEGVTKEEWERKKVWKEYAEQAALAEMRDYAAFAWGKALDHRGLSAGRSIEKLEAWAWLLDRDDVVAASQAAPHENYGCPKLKVICEAFGFPIPSSEEAQRMARGEMCRPDCENGCGR